MALCVHGIVCWVVLDRMLAVPSAWNKCHVVCMHVHVHAHVHVHVHVQMYMYIQLLHRHMYNMRYTCIYIHTCSVLCLHLYFIHVQCTCISNIHVWTDVSYCSIAFWECTPYTYNCVYTYCGWLIVLVEVTKQQVCM